MQCYVNLLSNINRIINETGSSILIYVTYMMKGVKNDIEMQIAESFQVSPRKICLGRGFDSDLQWKREILWLYLILWKPGVINFRKAWSFRFGILESKVWGLRFCVFGSARPWPLRPWPQRSRSKVKILSWSLPLTLSLNFEVCVLGLKYGFTVAGRCLCLFWSCHCWDECNDQRRSLWASILIRPVPHPASLAPSLPLTQTAPHQACPTPCPSPGPDCPSPGMPYTLHPLHPACLSPCSPRLPQTAISHTLNISYNLTAIHQACHTL